MRKSVFIFMLAVIIPSAVLGWLALRSAEEQQIILERRTAELYQHETEELAAAARGIIDEQRRAFSEAVRTLLASTEPDELAREFSSRLSATWPRKAVGFSLDAQGRLVSPAPSTASANPDVQRFIWDNASFLGGDISATVYNVQVDNLNKPDILRRSRQLAQSDISQRPQTLDRADGAANPGANELTGALMLKQAPAPTANKKEVLAFAVPDAPALPGLSKATPAPAAASDFGKSRAPVPPAAPQSTSVEEEIIVSKRAYPRREVQRDSAPQRTGRGVSEEKSDSSPIDSLSSADPVAIPAEKKLMQDSRSFGAELGVHNFNAPPSAAGPAPLYADAPSPSQSGAGSTAETAALGRIEQLSQQLRLVQPRENFGESERPAWSFLEPETAEFSTLSRHATEGIIARFVQDRLTLLFWLRPPQAPERVFGCVLDAADLQDLWDTIVPTPRLSLRGAPEFILALLDEKGRPVTRSPSDAPEQTWKRPFVATEIGEALPHWEAALYLMQPEQIQASARGWKRTLTFLIVGLLGAIAFGGWLVVADARRQMALAQQKTDFVSNVSHELKTPLTSIRMFAELMLTGRRETAEKSSQYLRIIMVEAERLTRLINNVLDFAKLERRQKRIERKPLDLHQVIATLWESQEVHLRECGFSTRWEAAPGPYPVLGDDDALAQILVNLLSNAEKYSAERKEIDLHSWLDGGRVHISVLDRGAGIPPGEEGKIFEPFYRAHDSLSSGIQGSGLGLTLAQRLAHDSGGTLTCGNRDGGGSAFTLSIPLSEPTPAT